ncbi:MAG: hypothetical protein ACI4U2_03130, partial [Christensenellaceae bacterium]
KTTVYVDGPFFPDETLPKSEQKAKLRDEVYRAMAARSECSTYSKNRYVKREEAAEEAPKEAPEDSSKQTADGRIRAACKAEDVRP